MGGIAIRDPSCDSEQVTCHASFISMAASCLFLGEQHASLVPSSEHPFFTPHFGRVFVVDLDQSESSQVLNA